MGAANVETRHAVFSFLAGFWRRNYESAIAQMSQPTLVLMGEAASSISRDSAVESPEERMINYCRVLPNGEAKMICGRNVLPYESPTAFTTACQEFVQPLRTQITSG